jgi:hypothetical protein
MTLTNRLDRPRVQGRMLPDRPRTGGRQSGAAVTETT